MKQGRAADRPGAAVSRRRLLGGAAGAVAAGLAVTAYRTSDPANPTPVRAGATGPAVPPSTTVPVDPARWLVEENARPGAAGWPVPDTPAMWEKVRGFASSVSVGQRGAVDLHVSTKAPEWRVEAYRIGWYGGAGARLVWESGPQRGEVQDPARRDARTGTWRAPWRPNLEVRTDDTWPPGMYLLKLVSSDGGQSYVPLTLRDDASTAALLVQSSVTTWQAYNEWGGSSLYTGTTTGPRDRSDVVTFDRPYYRNGSGEFFGREFEFILFAERMGYDLTYWTDIDLHATPERVEQHRAVITLGHDEYYSTRMRRGLEAARDVGVNLVFLGANACFRKIRLEDSPVGAYRDEVNYRSAERDPVTRTDPDEATVTWRNSPVREPESSLVGNYYESNPVEADMVVANPDNWLLEGTNLRKGDKLRKLVGNEYDRVTPEAPTPPDIEVICHSPVVCRGKRSFADVTWYSAPSGAGVFASGTFWWIPRLAPDVGERRPSAADPDAAVQRATRNLLDAVSAGPAGTSHPARNNLAQLGIRKGYVKDPPPT